MAAINDIIQSVLLAEFFYKVFDYLGAFCAGCIAKRIQFRSAIGCFSGNDIVSYCPFHRHNSLVAYIVFVTEFIQGIAWQITRTLFKFRFIIQHSYKLYNYEILSPTPNLISYPFDISQ